VALLAKSEHDRRTLAAPFVLPLQFLPMRALDSGRHSPLLLLGNVRACGLAGE